MIRWITGVLDSPSPDADDFWQAVTSSTLSPWRDAGGDSVTLRPAYGDPFLALHVVEEGPARAHLDLHVDDVAAQARRMVDVGAAVVRRDGELVALSSPAGLSFSLVPWRGESAWPEAEGRLHRMCLDTPSAMFDVEGRFWSTALVRERPTPLNVLMRRVSDDEAGMHLHLRCADRAAEARRHAGLGASIARVAAEQTTLRDPVGRQYCLTSPDA
ncbi:VOC family protein [Jidongwangia harbinensis]|uniref:VOC family protein n=1 Tax=Jidongwangia harbinensis TaxID=2878561 RepID=UPI001CDA04E0|nr:VOC family protein [Jidongwangia harbinensis]MCA2219019.1 hypothetical protein [Jidongwangia harbinensis]